MISLDMHKSEIQIPCFGGILNAALDVPKQPVGIVIFSHGSGSSRHSPRNQQVAKALNEAHFATLLLDLLTEAEDEGEKHGGMLRFDIDLLSERLLAAALWCEKNAQLKALPIGLFGASTGAACALRLAAEHAQIKSVVSRGGRGDLAGEALAQVRCPVLLIVGGDDHVVIDLNRRALSQLAGPKRLDIVPGATHLFEEPGTLEAVAEKAVAWFSQTLKA